MFRVAVVVVALWLVGIAAASAEIESFQSPSKGISCAYDGGSDDARPSITCEVANFVGALPPRPKDCELDWIPRASISTSNSKAFIGSCAGDTIALPTAPVLSYGTRFVRGPLRCASATTGFACTNGRGIGFRISKRSLTRI